jgi:uncharacterized phage protein gp47/JayE
MPEPSARDLYDLGRAVLLIRRSGLVVSPGDITDVQLWAATAMADLVIGRGASNVAATFLQTSEGDLLTELVRDHWAIDRLEATEAIGEVTFSRAGAGGAGNIPTGTRVATTPDAAGNTQVFVTTADAVFADVDTSKTVATEAAQAGAEGNVVAGAVTRILDELFESGFSVTNAERFAGGAAEESDPDLRARVRGRDRTIRRATLDALVVGALQVETVQTASVVEDTIAGSTTVFVADADGNSNGAMEAAVEAELVNWRAAGVSLTVTGGVRVVQAIDFSLVVQVGASPAALALAARQAVVSAVNRLRPGETLYRSLIRAAARSVDTEAIKEVVVNTPATDVAPSSNQIIRAELGSTSVS